MLKNGCVVRKSSGRRGWEWVCPKGFVYYNFNSELEATKDAMIIIKEQTK